MPDRVERYVFSFETLGPQQVVAAMQAIGAEEVRLHGTMGQFTDAIKKQSGAVQESTSRWRKHLTWIAQGILIWEGIRVIKTVIGDWLTVQKDLDTELVRFRIAMGDSDEVAQAYLKTVMAISREMRMPPGQIAGAVGVAYRVGEVEIAEYAAGIARLTGGDTRTILRELIALHRQFPEQRMIDLMDTYISAWQRSTLTAGEFFNLLESSGGLVKFFNTDLNTLLNLFVHITTVAGEAGGSVERFVRMFTKFYEEGHKLRAATEQFIGPTVMFDPATGQEVRRPIEDIIRAIGELNEAQQQIIANNFPSMLGQQYGPWFLQVVKGFEVAEVSAGAFDRAMALMSDSFQDKVRGMEAAWKRFLLGLGDLGPLGVAVEIITGVLDIATERGAYQARREAWAAPGEPEGFVQTSEMEFWRRLLRRRAREAQMPMSLQQFQQWGAYGVGTQAHDWGAPYRQPAYTGEYDVPLPPGLPGPPGEGVVLPEGMDLEQLQEGFDLLSAEIEQAEAAAGFFVNRMEYTAVVTNEFGVIVGTVTTDLADLSAGVKFTTETLAQLPQRFAQMTPAEWALTKQLYGGYEERYLQYPGVPIGKEMELIGPGGDPFTVYMEPWADATKEQTVLTRAHSKGTQELIRWQERSAAAYKKGVAAWESMITGLPGVTTPTDVTAFDLYAMTPAGLYEDKWDEPMRQLKQDVNDMLAGKKPQYGVIYQPWAQEFFGPVMGMIGTGTPEARLAAGGAYEQAAGAYYGLALPWEVYEPQAGALVAGAQKWAEDRAAREANVERMKQLVIDADLGPDVLGFIEYEEMSPLAKWVSGGKMPSELKEELDALGGVAGKGVREGMLGEFEENPWIDDAVAAWKTEAKTEDNTALFVGVGQIIGSNMQTGLVEAIADNIFPKIVAYMLKLLAEEE